MLDCGVHLGHSDDRRYPDFRKILGPAAAGLGGGADQGAAYTAAIDCVLITHFHLDHVGGLPYFTEVCGYRGPVYMTVRPPPSTPSLPLLRLTFPSFLIAFGSSVLPSLLFLQYPTKVLAPLMLEDYRKVAAERRGEAEAVTLADIRASLARATAVDIRQTVDVGGGLRICAYYAGHVLGAAMFHIAAESGESVVYTGDFSTAPDRHLGPASIDRLEPDLLISEATYATTVRDSKRLRERDFLRAVSGSSTPLQISQLPSSFHARRTDATARGGRLAAAAAQVQRCLSRGGKVLIPVFALGRAQELCILLDEFWEQAGIVCHIYFSAGTFLRLLSLLLAAATAVHHFACSHFLTASAPNLSSPPSSLYHSFFLLPAAGLTAQANVYYKLLIGWTNQKVKATHVSRNTFDFHHVAPFERGALDAPSPCVLFATPGMLTGGLSLEAFRKWAPNDANMVVLPGYCMAGTIGAKLMAGKLTVVRLDKRTTVDVRCEIFHLSFSAHADAKGILDLARTVAPRCAVMLVHGERAKMAALAPRLAAVLGVPVLHPPNLAEVAVPDAAPGIAIPSPLAAIPS
eukprot:SM000006S19509  [mRNA]  locus=s6:1237766:1241023:+ [translate_table: standard]